MTKNSDSVDLVGVQGTGDAVRARLSPIQTRLRWIAGVLGLLNAIALYFFLSPPGGTRQDLEVESAQIHTQILGAQTQSKKARGISAQVQTASVQSASFSDRYFLPRRTAYVAVIEEIQRMAKASGIQERDAGLSEEPIEGSADLSLVNITANYEGTNANLMKFLYESDHSPMLLILDTLNASPQQKNNQISASIRFQAIVREGGPSISAAPPPPPPAAPEPAPSGAAIGGESGAQQQ